jgi:hypothetical protein
MAGGRVDWLTGGLVMMAACQRLCGMGTERLSVCSRRSTSVADLVQTIRGGESIQTTHRGSCFDTVPSASRSVGQHSMWAAGADRVCIAADYLPHLILVT